MVPDRRPNVTNVTAADRFPRLLRVSLHDVLSGQRSRRIGCEHARSLVEVKLGRDLHADVRRLHAALVNRATRAWLRARQRRRCRLQDVEKCTLVSPLPRRLPSLQARLRPQVPKGWFDAQTPAPASHIELWNRQKGQDAGYLWPMLQSQAAFPRLTADRFTSALSLLWFALLPLRGKLLPANGNGHELSVFIGPVVAACDRWIQSLLPRRR